MIGVSNAPSEGLANSLLGSRINSLCSSDEKFNVNMKKMINWKVQSIKGVMSGFGENFWRLRKCMTENPEWFGGKYRGQGGGKTVPRAWPCAPPGQLLRASAFGPDSPGSTLLVFLMTGWTVLNRFIKSPAIMPASKINRDILLRMME